MPEPMGTDQEFLAWACRDSDLVPAKAVAHETSYNLAYIYELMQGNRNVPVRMLNGVLRVAQNLYGCQSPIFMGILRRGLPLLISDLYLEFEPCHPPGQPAEPKLCDDAGVLLEDMGGVVRACGRILADGQIDEQDRSNAEELDNKSRILRGRLRDINVAVQFAVRQAAGSKGVQR